MNKQVIATLLGFMMGISAAWYKNMFDVYHLPLLISVIFSVSVIFFTREKRHFSSLMILFILGVCGGYGYTSLMYEQVQGRVNEVCSVKKCETRGVVIYIKEQTIERTILDIRHMGIITRHYIHKPHRAVVRVGDEVIIQDKFSHDTGFKDERGHLVHMRSYFIGEGIDGVSYRSILISVNPKDTSLFSLHGIARMRQGLAVNLSAMLGGTPGSLASGIVLGDGSGLTKQVKADFSSSSLSHILVASGYNISIVIEQIVMIVGRGFVASLFLGFLIIILVIFYGTGPSILRAGIMAGIIMFRDRFGRNTESLYVLLIAVFIMLLWNPLLLLHSLSFQLSVMATMGILVLEPLLKRLLFSNTVRFSFLKGSVIVSLSAFLGTLPIIIESFGVVSLFGIFLNIVAGVLLPFYYFGTMLYLLVYKFFGGITIVSTLLKNMYGYLYDVVRFFAQLQIGFSEEYVWYFAILTWCLWFFIMWYAYEYKE